MSTARTLTTTKEIDHLIDFILYEVLKTERGEEKNQEEYVMFLSNYIFRSGRSSFLYYAGIDYTPAEQWSTEDTFLDYSVVRIKASELRAKLNQNVCLVVNNLKGGREEDNELLTQMLHNNSKALNYIYRAEHAEKEERREARERLIQKEEERLFNEKEKLAAREIEQRKIYKESKITSLAVDDKELDEYLESIKPSKKPWWRL